MERSIILVRGMPGGGKSTLSKNLVEALRPTLSIEHISVGDTVRKIGRGAIDSFFSHRVIEHLNSPRAVKPIEDIVIAGVISEALARSDDADHILLDGYPRSPTQAEDIFQLSAGANRTVAGAITATTHDNLAIMRMIKRRTRDFSPPLTVSAAKDRLDEYYTLCDATTLELQYQGLAAPEIIDTSGSKESATHHGLIAVQSFLDLLDDQENAS